MAGGSTFHELTEGQRQIYRAAAEIYRAYLETVRQGLALKGGMHWKKIRGREYLYRYRDRLRPRREPGAALASRPSGSSPISPGNATKPWRAAPGPAPAAGGAGPVLPGGPDPPGAPDRGQDLAAPGSSRNRGGICWSSAPPPFMPMNLPPGFFCRGRSC